MQECLRVGGACDGYFDRVSPTGSELIDRAWRTQVFFRDIYLRFCDGMEDDEILELGERAIVKVIKNYSDEDAFWVDASAPAMHQNGGV